MTKKRTNVSYDAPIVWAAAAAAQRINNGYVKVNQSPDGTKIDTNRQLLDMFLGKPELLKEEDYTQGTTVRKYYQGYALKFLSGTRLSDFDNAAMTIASKDTITATYDISVICALPSCYIRASERDRSARRIAFANGGFLGTPGEKIRIEDAEVVKCFYSTNYGVHYVTVVTPDDNAVFFASKEALLHGSKVTVAGTVKSHKENATQLNRIKVIEIKSKN